MLLWSSDIRYHYSYKWYKISQYKYINIMIVKNEDNHRPAMNFIPVKLIKVKHLIISDENS